MANQARPQDPDWTDAEAEGQPDLADQPPGIDAETASEGEFPPRDEPLAADDPETTAAGAAQAESVAERARRDEPETLPGPDGIRGRIVDSAPDDSGWEPDAAGLSSEEDAVQVRRTDAEGA